MAQPLVVDDDDRYSRLRLIPWWEQSRLAQARVLVVGAGALGNEVLKNLALVGVGQVAIVDMDSVESSNLTRSVLFRSADRNRPKALVAAAAARELNPDLRVTPLVGNVLTDIGLGWFRGAHVVIGCLDNREARWWVNRQCWKVSVPWIDGAIQELNGVVKAFVPPESACYECGMTENDFRLINLRYSCPLLRREDLQAGKVPTVPTIAAVIAGLQVQEALKILHGLPVAAGQAHVFNGVVNRMYTTAFQRREDCLSHDTWTEILEAPELTPQISAQELLRWLAARVGATSPWEAAVLELDRDLLLALECPKCQLTRDFLQPVIRVDARQASCPACGEQSRPRLTCRIGGAEPLAERSLAELGIPAGDIVRVALADREWRVQLAGSWDGSS